MYGAKKVFGPVLHIAVFLDTPFIRRCNAHVPRSQIGTPWVNRGRVPGVCIDHATGEGHDLDLHVYPPVPGEVKRLWNEVLEMNSAVKGFIYSISARCGSTRRENTDCGRRQGDSPF